MKFLTTICMAAIASALFRMIVPENKLAKQVSFLIVCVFIMTAITAFTGAELDIDTNGYELSGSDEYINFSENVNKSLQKKVCKEMSDKVFALMHENGFYPKEIHVVTNISGLYGINITQVKLVFESERANEADAAAAFLEKELSDAEIKVVAAVKG